MRWLRWTFAVIVCGIAVLLPYRARAAYGRGLAWAAHLPFLLFGRLARYLLRQVSAPNPCEPGRP